MTTHTHDNEYVFLNDDSPETTVDIKDPWLILIVDDEPDVHKATRFAFSGMIKDNKILLFESCFSGREALKRISTYQKLPDLVLMDVVMDKDSDGIDTIHEIRKELAQRYIPYVILQTRQAGTELTMDALHNDPEIDNLLLKSELTVEKLRAAVLSGLDTTKDRMQKIKAQQLGS